MALVTTVSRFGVLRLGSGRLAGNLTAGSLTPKTGSDTFSTWSEAQDATGAQSIVPAADMFVWAIEGQAAGLSGIPFPTITRVHKRRAVRDQIEWTLDGQPIFVGGPGSDETWSARMTAPGGFDSFSGVALITPGTRQADQGSTLVGYRSNGEVLAEYELDSPPRMKNNRVSLHGRGLKHKLELKTSRLFFQSKDFGIWSPQHNDPYGYNADDTISADAEAAALSFKIAKGEDIHNNDQNGLLAWVQGTHLTRVAWDEYTSGTWPSQASNSYTIQVMSTTGPTGSGFTSRYTRTPDTSESAQGRETGDLGSPDEEDMVVIRLTRTVATTPSGGLAVLRVRNLRLNGLAGTSDEFLASDVINYLGGQIGFDNSLLTDSPTNVLPLDWQSGGWDQLADYVASIDDWVWLVLEDRYGRGPILTYQPWGAKEWQVSTETNVLEDLELLELFNRVSVPWTTPDGVDQTFLGDASDFPGLTDKLIRKGITNEYQLDAIQDPQSDSTLAAQLAYNVLKWVSDYRVQGSVQIGSLTDDHGVHSPYAVDAGDTLNLSNFNPDLPPQRVVGVTYTPSDVKCDVGQDISASGQLALLTNEQLRNPSKPGRHGRHR